MCAFNWDSAGVCELKRASQHYLCKSVLDNGREPHLLEDVALSGTETEGGKSLMREGDVNFNETALYWSTLVMGCFVVG